MDGRGGCCIARYAGGGAYHTSKMDQIMLRFRPIAPKPASDGSVSGGFTPDNGFKTGRCKRKYVKESSSSGSNNSSNNNNNNNNNKRWCNKRRKASPEETTVVTLPLLPESPERKDSPSSGSLSGHLDLKTTASTPQNHAPIWMNFDGSGGMLNNQLLYGFSGGSSDHHPTAVVMPRAVKIAGSCVTVERVTDTWTDGDGMGCTDEERVRNLARDTCPGFVSDALNRVTWTNGAYKKMVNGGGGGGGGDEMMVGLVMKEKVPVSVTYPAFTCRVRMQYTCRSGKEKRSSLTLPCDVWRMDGGGFAWRLDVKAALCLGR